MSTTVTVSVKASTTAAAKAADHLAAQPTIVCACAAAAGITHNRRRHNR
ncbi:MAG: hypothetical protein R2867_28945 [Caldilineaceae bacterium]